MQFSVSVRCFCSILWAAFDCVPLIPYVRFDLFIYCSVSLCAWESVCMRPYGLRRWSLYVVAGRLLLFGHRCLHLDNVQQPKNIFWCLSVRVWRLYSPLFECWCCAGGTASWLVCPFCMLVSSKSILQLGNLWLLSLYLLFFSLALCRLFYFFPVWCVHPIPVLIRNLIFMSSRLCIFIMYTQMHIHTHTLIYYMEFYRHRIPFSLLCGAGFSRLCWAASGVILSAFDNKTFVCVYNVGGFRCRFPAARHSLAPIKWHFFFLLSGSRMQLTEMNKKLAHINFMINFHRASKNVCTLMK